MSNSLQLQVKNKSIFILIISLNVIFLYIQNISAFEFGVSPAELNFEGKQDEKICKSVSIFSSLNKINISAQDKWAIKYTASKNIRDHIVDSEELGITLEYEEDFILNKKKETNICLKSKNAEKFKGILLFQALNNSLVIGIWINANISKSNQASKITGFSISEFDSYGSMKVFLPLTILNLICLIGLIVLYIKKKKSG